MERHLGAAGVSPRMQPAVAGDPRRAPAPALFSLVPSRRWPSMALPRPWGTPRALESENPALPQQCFDIALLVLETARLERDGKNSEDIAEVLRVSADEERGVLD